MVHANSVEALLSLTNMNCNQLTMFRSLILSTTCSNGLQSFDLSLGSASFHSCLNCNGSFSFVQKLGKLPMMLSYLLLLVGSICMPETRIPLMIENGMSGSAFT